MAGTYVPVILPHSFFFSVWVSVTKKCVNYPTYRYMILYEKFKGV